MDVAGILSALALGWRDYVNRFFILLCVILSQFGLTYVAGEIRRGNII